MRMREHLTRRRGQSIYMVLILLIIALIWMFWFWYNAINQYRQSARFAAWQRGDLWGRTAGEAVTTGIRQGTAAWNGGPAAVSGQPLPNPPLPPPPTIGVPPAPQQPGMDQLPVAPPPGQPGQPGGLQVRPLPANDPGPANRNAPDALNAAAQNVSPGAITRAPWMTDLLNRLEQDLFSRLQSNQTANPNTIIPDLQVRMPNLASQLAPLLGQLPPGVRLKDVTAVANNFRRMVFLPQSGLLHENMYYREEVQGDRNPQKRIKLVPADFWGKLTLNVVFEATVAGRTVELRREIRLDLKVQDVYPPAQEFALFSFGPVMNDQVKFDDLNSGTGCFGVLARGRGRIFARGPMFLKVEDPSPRPGLASDNNGADGKMRPDPGLHLNFFANEPSKYWAGYSTIPAPRAVPMPNFNWSPSEVFDAVTSAIGNLIGSISGGTPGPAHYRAPIRPSQSDYKFGFMLGFTPDLMALGTSKLPFLRGNKFGNAISKFAKNDYTKTAGAMLGGWAGIWQPFLCGQIALAPTTSYYCGSTPAGTQTFSLTGVPAAAIPKLSDIRFVPQAGVFNIAGGPMVSPFNGVLLRPGPDEKSVQAMRAAPVGVMPKVDSATGRGLGLLTQGTNAPETFETEDGDLVAIEPAFYTHRTNGGTATPVAGGTQGTTADPSILGVYGIATYSRTIYWNFDLLEILTYIKWIGRAVGLLSAGSFSWMTVITEGAAQAGEGILKSIGRRLLGAVCSIRIVPLGTETQIPTVAVDLRKSDEQIVADGYMAMPYGIHYDQGKAGIWDELMSDAILVGQGIAITGIFKLIASIASRSGGPIAAAQQAQKAQAGATRDLVTSGQVSAANQNALVRAAGGSADEAANAARAAGGAADDALGQVLAHTHPIMDDVAKTPGLTMDQIRGRILSGPNGSQQMWEAFEKAVQGGATPQVAAREFLSRVTPITGAAAGATSEGAQIATAALGAAAGKAPRATAWIAAFANAAGQRAQGLISWMRTGDFANKFNPITRIAFGYLLLNPRYVPFFQSHLDRNMAENSAWAGERPVPTGAGRAALDPNAYPKGFMPGKYRGLGYLNAAGKRFATMDEFLAATSRQPIATIRGQSTLAIAASGIYRIDNLNYDAPNQTIVYSGKFVLVGAGAHGQDCTMSASFQASGEAGGGRSNRFHMTIVYETPDGRDGQSPHDAQNSMLKLGKYIQGSVVCGHGVKPARAGGVTLIDGNLITRYINKRRIDDGSVVVVQYDMDRMNGQLADIKNWWTMAVSVPSDVVGRSR